MIKYLSLLCLRFFRGRAFVEYPRTESPAVIGLFALRSRFLQSHRYNRCPCKTK
jgi:hypothetical protein